MLHNTKWKQVDIFSWLLLLVFNLVPNSTTVLRKTQDIWNTWSASSMCINTRHKCFSSRNRFYVNVIDNNVDAANVGFTQKLDCIFTSWGSVYVAESNITHFQCAILNRNIILVNIHRVLDFNKCNIFVFNVPRISRSSLIQIETKQNMNNNLRLLLI